jgi:hypothetical protein
MTLKTKLMMFTAAVAFSASMAQAAITANDVVKTYQDGAYTSIEVVDGPTQIKVEAIKDGVKIEVIYDKASGAVIKTEQHNVTGTESGSTAVEVTTSDSDFDEDHGGNTAGSDDGDSHDVGNDNGGDAVGSDDGDGHDLGDDNGGDTAGSDDGDSHGAGDNHGGDDNDNDSGESDNN